MTVKAIMPVRVINLVVPLVFSETMEATAMRVTDTAGCSPGRSGAVSPLIGESNLRPGDVDSTNDRSTPRIRPMRGSRASTTAIRTTTTRTTTTGRARSADESVSRHAEFSFTDLVAAYFDCRRTKRNTHNALAFEAALERNLRDLYEELAGGTYRPGHSICFVVTRPRPREVWAADFRDRIVHHLLYNRISPRFYAAFIADSCACIPGRGTLYAARRLEAKIRSITQNWRRPAYYLKADVANFFVAIDKRILWNLLEPRITGTWWIKLARLILFHDPCANAVFQSTQAQFAQIPPAKRLLLQPAHLGIPIGNLSSQFFANIYLDVLDQFIKHQLRAKYYLRYVDDFVLLHESAQWLNAALIDISALLEARLHLRLNPAKTILQPVDRGVDIAGQIIKPWHRTMRRRTVNNALRRIHTLNPGNLFESANSYFGLLRQASHSHVDRARLANALRERGHAINGAFTKIYRRHSDGQ
jgi:RNA-directed DNA polymerase